MKLLVVRIWHRNAVNSAGTLKINEETLQIKPWKEVPGPQSLPVIGQLHHFLPGGSLFKLSATEFANKLYNSFGPIIRLDGAFGAPPVLLLSDPDGCEQILRGENLLPNRPGLKSLEYYRYKYKKTQAPDFTGLLTDHGETWKKFRSKVNPPMLQPKTIKLYSSSIDEVAKDMIARIKSIREEENRIKNNFDVEMNLWALESIGVVALGGRLNCFDPNLPEDSPARKLINVIHNIFGIIEKLDFRPNLWRYYSTPLFKKAMKLYEEQEYLTKYFVGKATERLKSNNVTNNDEKGVLEKLLEIDETVAHVMASDMLFAGVDTTSNTVMATLYLLATNPEKQEKLRKEVLSDQDKRPYLRACIKESLRLLPITAVNAREIIKDYNISGYNIPKGTLVVFQHENMSKMENQFTRSKEFIPERWLVEKDDSLYYGNAHPFAYNPFGFGVRGCIGRRIAELEVETFLKRILENFKVEWSGPPINIKRSSLNYLAPPFNFTFKDI
ncbi:cytochrome P450 CYP12A2-like [Aphomia sociella]